MCKSLLVLIIWLSVAPRILIAAPARRGKDVVFIPANRLIQIPPQYNNPYQQQKEPLDFITSFLQSQSWLPIEINIPSILSGIGNGFQSGISSIQNGLQMVGSNVSNIAGSFFQRIPAVGNVITGGGGGGGGTPHAAPQEIVVMLPVQRNGAIPNHIASSLSGKLFQSDLDKLPIYP